MVNWFWLSFISTCLDTLLWLLILRPFPISLSLYPSYILVLFLLFSLPNSPASTPLLFSYLIHGLLSKLFYSPQPKSTRVPLPCCLDSFVYCSCLHIKIPLPSLYPSSPLSLICRTHSFIYFRLLFPVHAYCCHLPILIR